MSKQKLRVTNLKPEVDVGECDICGMFKAKYDGKTFMGAWANMCDVCFKNFGVGLGMGKGQILNNVEVK